MTSRKRKDGTTPQKNPKIARTNPYARYYPGSSPTPSPTRSPTRSPRPTPRPLAPSAPPPSPPSATSKNYQRALSNNPAAFYLDAESSLKSVAKRLYTLWDGGGRNHLSSCVRKEKLSIRLPRPEHYNSLGPAYREAERITTHILEIRCWLMEMKKAAPKERFDFISNEDLTMHTIVALTNASYRLNVIGKWIRMELRGYGVRDGNGEAYLEALCNVTKEFRNKVAAQFPLPPPSSHTNTHNKRPSPPARRTGTVLNNRQQPSPPLPRRTTLSNRQHNWLNFRPSEAHIVKEMENLLRQLRQRTKA